MTVACYCGEVIEVDDTMIVCPRCGEPADLPLPSPQGNNELS